MTRETKVGLLVGLGIILLTCIILTDFLTLPPQSDDPIGPLLDSVQDVDQQLIPPPIDSLEQIVQETQPWVRDDLTGQSQTSQPNYFTEPVDVMAGSSNVSQQDPVQSGLTAEQLKQTGTPTPTTKYPKVIKPKRIIYYTKPNDNLSDIAVRFYGKANKWRLIRDANPKAVRPDGGIGVGVRLIIPALDAKAPAPRLTADLAVAGQNTTGQHKLYVVQANDRLWDIAEDYLGAGSRYHEILKLNRSVIKNADQLKVGMKLMIPAR